MAASKGLIARWPLFALALTPLILAGLGGQSLVRGYTLDDGAFDAGLIARNEFRAPPVSWLPRQGVGAFSPFVFVDLGFGRDYALRSTRGAAAVGFGGDVRLGPHISANLAAAWALADEGLTQAGAFRLESRVNVGF